MKIVREALAGTMESSDLMVKIAPADGELDIVIQLRWQRPGQAGAAGSVEVLADRALGQAEAAGNGALRHADAVVQA